MCTETNSTKFGGTKLGDLSSDVVSDRSYELIMLIVARSNERLNYHVLGQLWV